MIELKINSGHDRDNVALALVNAGYTVRVIQRKHPTKYAEHEYFIQIVDENIQQPTIVINTYINGNQDEVEKIVEAIKERLKDFKVVL